MGIGRFDSATHKFNLLISLQYPATAADLTSWQKTLQRASELLFDATDGKHQLGSLFVDLNSLGVDIADMWILGTAGTATSGGYAVLGTGGVHMTINSDEMLRPLVIVHELGHYVYGLRDEYLRPGGVGGGFCHGHDAKRVPKSNACIMEANQTDGDVYNAAIDSWSPGPISEFCSNNDHNGTLPYQNMQQGISCWQSMASRYPDLSPIPTTPTETPPPQQISPIGVDLINWIVLTAEQRFAIVVDRSASMTGNKLTAAKNGADWWVDAAVVNDNLAIVSFADTASIDYARHPIVDVTDRTSAHAAIGSLTAGGSASIGDGLRAAVNQILTPGQRAAIQVIVLLTDGYNTGGEDPNTVLPDLVANGVQVYTIGIGPNIDSNLLQQIATQTGGRYYRIDPALAQSVQEAQIRINMIEISGIARAKGGLVTSVAGSTNPGIQEEMAYIEPGCELATFALAWANPNDLLSLVLKSPTGEIITLTSASDNVRPIYSERPYMGFQIEKPDSGSWKLIVRPERVADIAHFNLFVFSQNQRIGGGIMSPWRFYKPGDTIPLQFQSYFDRPITGLKVSGTVLLPGAESISLEFSDDGRQELGDEISGDGLYSTLFRHTQTPGIYTIKVIVASDGETAIYAKSDEPPGEDQEHEYEPILPFRREFMLALAVGEEPIKRVEVEPNSSYPGDRLQTMVKGRLTHFRQGDTAFDFGKGISVSDTKVIDVQTALITLHIDKAATFGSRNVTITTEIFNETVEVEAGFQVGRHKWNWSEKLIIRLLVFLIIVLTTSLLIIAVLLMQQG